MLRSLVGSEMCIRDRSIGDFYILLARRNEIRAAVTKRLFSRVEQEELLGGRKAAVGEGVEKVQCDAFLVPSFTIPPPLCGDSKDLSFGIMYTSYFNLLDLPSCTFATTTVDSNLDAWDEETTGLRYVLQQHYNATKMHGLPVGVQIVTKRGADEQCLGIAKLVDNIVNKTA
eukprot:TRINITY_DN6394_c0_g1_i3.p1 TRINITY_DN6394_c0_g1~~TRINITY_DN6394_c0_g1_i3.p1  ORF type:complete len:172 (+),score=30.07 TRINITY_DN6394_c0_g1_i3:145-660(+)